MKETYLLNTDAFITSSQNDDDTAIAIGCQYALVYHKDEYLIWTLNEMLDAIDVLGIYDDSLMEEVMEIYTYVVKYLYIDSNIEFWLKSRGAGRPPLTMEDLYNRAKEVDFEKLT